MGRRELRAELEERYRFLRQETFKGPLPPRRERRWVKLRPFDKRPSFNRGFHPFYFYKGPTQ